MRLQTKWVIAVLSAGLSLAPVLAPAVRAADEPPKQGRRGGSGGMLERYHTMVNSLDLTDQQKPTIEAAFTEAKTAAEGVMKDAAGDRQAAREKMKPIMEALTAKVVAVLTDDQKAKLEKLRDEARQAGGKGAGGAGPRSKPAN